MGHWHILNSEEPSRTKRPLGLLTTATLPYTESAHMASNLPAHTGQITAFVVKSGRITNPGKFRGDILLRQNTVVQPRTNCADTLTKARGRFGTRFCSRNMNTGPVLQSLLYRDSCRFRLTGQVFLVLARTPTSKRDQRTLSAMPAAFSSTCLLNKS